MNKYLRTYAEVSLAAIHHNVEEARKRLLPGTKVLAVVKADAYGHGAVRVAQSLEDIADFFAVATLEEGVELREHNIVRPILILGYTSPLQYSEMIAWDIRPSIYHYEDARNLSETAVREGKTARIHIALDTGMTRIGFQVTEEAADEIQKISELPNVEIEGLFTHLSCADMTDKTYCGR